MTFHVPEKFRICSGRMASHASDGNNGGFLVKLPRQQLLYCVASDGMEWEHVSVSRTDRCSFWLEMCSIKDLFWDAEDCVVQFHPPRSEYVNLHNYCLHLWRPVDGDIITPPSIMVGF